MFDIKVNVNTHCDIKFNVKHVLGWAWGRYAVLFYCLRYYVCGILFCGILFSAVLFPHTFSETIRRHSGAFQKLFKNIPETFQKLFRNSPEAFQKLSVARR